MASKKPTRNFPAWLDRLFQVEPSSKRYSFISLAVVGLLVILYLIYSLLFLGRVYPNVHVGDTQYSGLKQPEVEARLRTVVAASLAEPLTLTFKDKNYTVSAKDANWQPDVAGTVKKVYGVGRDDVWYRSFLAQITAPVYSRRQMIEANYDENYLKTTIAAVAEAVDQPAVNAHAEYQDDQLVITKEQTGEVIDREKVIQAVLNRWSSGSRAPITLVREKQKPTVYIANETELKDQANTLANQRLTLKWPTGEKTLTQKEMYRLIDFAGEDEDGSSRTVTPLVAKFTDRKTKEFVQALATETIDQPAEEPKLGIKDGKLVILTSSAEGRVVDVEQSTASILSSLHNPETEVAELTLKVQQPQIREDNLDTLGIKEMIGRGETNFTGSPTNRRINIANGVRLLQSTLVKPGAEFSTVKTLGAVDGSTGFLPELVIKDNRTTPEFGGGLCQVSTTLFRSVLQAGLKVTERQNHSYRVSYYEPPIGLDATIYLPRPDFKFLNDTGNHILVQGQVIGNRVIFELWGTKDGRTATVTDPVVSNILPPPPEVRTETDTLFRGEVKQIEKPHEGATAVAYYTVMKDGKVLHKQTFKSVYKPWAAKFLVGTKEPPAPPPPPAP